MSGSYVTKSGFPLKKTKEDTNTDLMAAADKTTPQNLWPKIHKIIHCLIRKARVFSKFCGFLFFAAPARAPKLKFFN